MTPDEALFERLVLEVLVKMGYGGSLQEQFSSDAREYVSRIEKKIVLIDGEMPAQFMIDRDVGVSRKAVYEIKEVQSDYFLEST